MTRKQRIVEEPVLPTEIEAHFGEVKDPRGHEEEIENAERILQRFCLDISTVSLRQVQSAASVLGNYAGYPKEAYIFESYLDSDLTQASYRTVAEHLPLFMTKMLRRIEARKHLLFESEKSNRVRPFSMGLHDDLPF